MDYLKHWFDHLRASPVRTVKSASSARGECHRNRGPHSWIAAVEISVEPGNTLEVDDTLPSQVRQALQQDGYYDQITFGVMDVMLTIPDSPLQLFKLRITDAEIHPIHSTPLAFRLAARDAARTILASLGEISGPSG